MSSAVISIELSEPLLAFASQEASRRGTTIANLVLEDLAHRMKVRVETEEFFRARRERAIPGAFQALLDRVPNRPPYPGDELE